METGDGSVVIGGFHFIRTIFGAYLWWSPCLCKIVDADSDQPLIDVQFHIITCEKECREAAA